MGTGCLATLFGIIALIRFWRTPVPTLWWTTLTLFLADIFLVNALKNSRKMYGPSANETKIIGLIGFSVQISLIVIGIRSFF